MVGVLTSRCASLQGVGPCRGEGLRLWATGFLVVHNLRAMPVPLASVGGTLAHRRDVRTPYIHAGGCSC